MGMAVFPDILLRQAQDIEVGLVPDVMRLRDDVQNAKLTTAEGTGNRTMKEYRRSLPFVFSSYMLSFLCWDTRFHYPS